MSILGAALGHSRLPGQVFVNAAMSVVVVPLRQCHYHRPCSASSRLPKLNGCADRGSRIGVLLPGRIRVRPDRAGRWIRDWFPLVSRLSGSVLDVGCGHRFYSKSILGAGHPGGHRLNVADVSSHRAACEFAARMTFRKRGDGIQQTTGGHVLSSRRAIADDRNGIDVPLTDLEKEKFKEVIIEPTNTLFTLPTILTLGRVAAVPAILAVFYSNQSWATATGVGIFVFAGLTDWLDGYLARKMGTSTAFGAFLDPVADKLMVATALVLLCTKPLAITELASIPWLLPVPTIAIIGREITMSAVREWAASQGGDLHKAVAVNSLGKIKTASQMVAISLLLASGEGGLDSKVAGVVGVSLLYVAAVLALWSLGMYMKGISRSLFK